MTSPTSRQTFTRPLPRRAALRLSAVGVGTLIAGSVGAARAQDATPGATPGTSPDAFEIVPGVTATDVVFVPGQDEPPVYRLRFDPGVEYEIPPSVALELVFIEAGTLVLQLDAPITIQHVAAANAGVTTVEADMEVSLTTGTYFVLPPGASGIVRNEDDTPAVVSVAGIIPSVQASPAATPAG